VTGAADSGDVPAPRRPGAIAALHSSRPFVTSRLRREVAPPDSRRADSEQDIVTSHSLRTAVLATRYGSCSRAIRAPLSRRTVLRGLGTALALPLFEAMLPSRAIAESRGSGAARTSDHAPRRLVFLYVPNGMNMSRWTPLAEGAGFELTPTLEPLAPLREEILLLSGLANDRARANGDGGGDHARACAAFLTAAQPFKTDGAGISAGVSVDQLAAREIGNRTRFRSLELGCDPGAQSGQCDSGYSCAYTSNLSWSTPHTPMAKETNPRLVFDRLFLGDDPSETAESRERRTREKKSILDFVRADAAALETKLGTSDRRKLDEYTTSVRELERRIDLAGAGVTSTCAGERPAGIPASFPDHVRLMSDLIVLALRCDVTRIATFMIANEGSGRSYPFAGAPEGHHELSHHGGDAAKLEKIAKIDRFHVGELAHLLERLSEIDEGGESLLHRSMVIYGSGISDGNKHNHEELPILLAGRGGGTIRTGRHVRYPKETPLANLHLALLDRMDVPAAAFGDSRGRLEL